MNPRKRIITAICLIVVVLSLFPRSVQAQAPLTEKQLFDQQVSELKTEFAAKISTNQVLTDTVTLAAVNGCQVVAVADEDPVQTSSENIKLVEGSDAAVGIKYYRSESHGMARLLAWQRWGFEAREQRLYYQVAVRTNTPTLLNVVQISADGSPADYIIKEVRGTGAWEVFIGVANPDNPNIAVSVSEQSDIVDIDGLALYACDSTDVFVPSLGANAYQPAEECGAGWVGRPRYGQSNEEIALDMLLVPGSVRTHPANGEYVCWELRQTSARDPQTGEVIDFLGRDRNEFKGMTVVPITLASAEIVPFWSSGVVATVGRAAPLGTKVLAGLSGWGVLLGVVSLAWSGWDAYVQSTDQRFERAALPYSYPEHNRVFYEQRFIDDATLFDEGTGKYFIYRTDQILAGDSYQSWVDPKQIVGVFTVNEENQPLRGFVMSLQNDQSKAFLVDSYQYIVLLYLSQIVGEIEEELEILEQHPAGPFRPGQGKLIADETAELIEGKRLTQILTRADGTCNEPVDEQDVLDDLRHDFFSWAPSVSREVIEAIQSDRMEVHYSDPLYQRVGGSGAAVHFPGFQFSDGKRHHLVYMCITGEGYGGWYKNDEFDEEYDKTYFPYEFAE